MQAEQILVAGIGVADLFGGEPTRLSGAGGRLRDDCCRRHRR